MSSTTIDRLRNRLGSHSRHSVFVHSQHLERFHIRFSSAKRSRSSKRYDRSKGVVEPLTRCLACIDTRQSRNVTFLLLLEETKTVQKRSLLWSHLTCYECLSCSPFGAKCPPRGQNALTFQLIYQASHENGGPGSCPAALAGDGARHALGHQCGRRGRSQPTRQYAAWLARHAHRSSSVHTEEQAPHDQLFCTWHHAAHEGLLAKGESPDQTLGPVFPPTS